MFITSKTKNLGFKKKGSIFKRNFSFFCFFLSEKLTQTDKIEAAGQNQPAGLEEQLIQVK